MYSTLIDWSFSHNLLPFWFENMDVLWVRNLLIGVRSSSRLRLGSDVANTDQIFCSALDRRRTWFIHGAPAKVDKWTRNIRRSIIDKIWQPFIIWWWIERQLHICGVDSVFLESIRKISRIYQNILNWRVEKWIIPSKIALSNEIEVLEFFLPHIYLYIKRMDSEGFFTVVLV